MIEIPSDLHKDLVPLAFLLGSWAGAGVHDFPGAEKCNFGQEVTFSHDGRDFLEFQSRTWVLDNDGNKVRPLETEHGFWRIDADRKVEVTMVRDDGVVEIWYGEMAAKKPQMTEFMVKHVKPEMAKLLNEPEFDPATKTGFGCGECHTMEK